ncbi:MAG: 4-hydroxy-tetrahydrodipicolinate reductase [Methanosarcinaceae archaeon]|nr:4-hydroxy-tetrahydrodipicolinate reductase [Methanosarcinaceae archaeon]
MSKNVRAAVCGACGRMGNLIVAKICETDGIELSAAFDITNVGKDIGEQARVGHLGIPVTNPEFMKSVLKETKTDVMIDFTVASATIENVPKAAEAGVDLIIGTTGFSDEEKEFIYETVKENNIRAVLSSNYSIGVNVFFKLLKEAAKELGDYDIEIIEAHHNKKKDAPSGTAVTAAETIQNNIKEQKALIYGRSGIAPRENEIAIHAIRGGDIVGDHTVLFAGNSERIEIRHQAHTRENFVSGAIRAAKWIPGKKPGVVYAMKDVLGFDI